MVIYNRLYIHIYNWLYIIGYIQSLIQGGPKVWIKIPHTSKLFSKLWGPENLFPRLGQSSMNSGRELWNLHYFQKFIMGFRTLMTESLSKNTVKEESSIKAIVKLVIALGHLDICIWGTWESILNARPYLIVSLKMFNQLLIQIRKTSNGTSACHDGMYLIDLACNFCYEWPIWIKIFLVAL